MTTMPTYIHLANYTQEGIENIGNHEPQPEAVIESLGAGELKSLYFTLGQYDVVALTEFPDDETATKFSIRMSQGGHSRAETLRAFTEEESLEIIEGVPE